uniref:Putative tick til 1 n=1 Tax=Amblyomma cajennense TaxID=34607 RepID=A0A023FSG0_AMBCJ
MGFKTLAFQLVVLVVVAVMVAEAKKDLDLARPKKCGRNEEFKECQSSSCAETSCKKPTIGPACTYDCVSGCFCSDGFFRNSQGACVTRNRCP